MTAGRMACIIIYELHGAGFLNTHNVNGPAAVVEETIRKRIEYGDLKCIPDSDELELRADGESTQEKQ